MANLHYFAVNKDHECVGVASCPAGNQLTMVFEPGKSPHEPYAMQDLDIKTITEEEYESYREFGLPALSVAWRPKPPATVGYKGKTMVEAGHFYAPYPPDSIFRR